MISGLFIEPLDFEEFFTDTDDECKGVIEFHEDFPINFNGEFFSKLYVSVLSNLNIIYGLKKVTIPPS